MLFALCLVRDPDERIQRAVSGETREDARDEVEEGREERAEENGG